MWLFFVGLAIMLTAVWVACDPSSTPDPIPTPSPQATVPPPGAAPTEMPSSFATQTPSPEPTDTHTPAPEVTAGILPDHTPSPTRDSDIVGEEKVVIGLVLENRLGCMADATCSLFLRVNGQELKVVYQWGGEVVPCTNQASEQGFEINEGDEVEVFGNVLAEDKISTCDSTDYYIRRIPQ